MKIRILSIAIYSGPGKDRKVRCLETGGSGLIFLSLRACCKNGGKMHFDINRTLMYLVIFLFLGACWYLHQKCASSIDDTPIVWK